MRLIDFVNFFLDKPWDWTKLSSNPSITFEGVKAHPDKPWDWQELSSNPSITFEDVKAHPGKPWDWRLLSWNLSITFEDVKAHPAKPWSWGLLGLSWNLSITFEDVKAHPDKPWDWGELSQNTFKGQHALNCQRIWRYYSEQKRFKAARKISSWAFEIYFDPSKGFIENSYMAKHFKELQKPHI